jgi:hypothetical protein
MWVKGTSGERRSEKIEAHGSRVPGEIGKHASA